MCRLKGKGEVQQPLAGSGLITDFIFFYTPSPQIKKRRTYCPPFHFLIYNLFTSLRNQGFQY